MFLSPNSEDSIENVENNFLSTDQDYLNEVKLEVKF